MGSGKKVLGSGLLTKEFAAALSLCVVGPGERACFAALQSLIDDCTALEPTQRPTMEVVVERIISVQDMYAVLMGSSAGGSAGSVPGEPASDFGFVSAAGSVALSVEDSRTQSPDAESPF